MTFKQMMEKANENNINAWKLLSAEEVAYWVDHHELKLTDSQFEVVCEFVYDWITSTEATASEITQLLFRTILDNDKYTFDNIVDYWSELTEDINKMI